MRWVENEEDWTIRAKILTFALKVRIISLLRRM